jgi:hypothetical protein
MVAEVVKHAAGAIPGAQYAGVTLTHDGQRVETLTSADEYPVNSTIFSSGVWNGSPDVLSPFATRRITELRAALAGPRCSGGV